jgi:N-acetylglucosaminyldiphosphoundecaprenol N-acetyl-beta-D-mannosaminyltransferase
VGSFTMEEAVRWVAQSIQEPSFHHVAVLNANKLWLANRNADLQSILQRAELIIPEFAIVWGCRVMRTPVRGHIGGIMLLQALLAPLEARGVPVYFLGAREDVLKQMTDRLRHQYPGLQIAGSRSGYFNLSESDKVVDAINDSQAQVLFVAMGSPRQELWIEACRERLRVRIAMGVGGSFDVLAGIKRDAPPYMRHGWEWLFRLAQDPKALWRRYLTTNPWFVTRVLRERLFSGRI